MQRGGLLQLLLVLIGTVCLQTVGWGQTFTGTGNWSDATKWSTGVLPTVGASVVIAGNCTLDGSYFVDNITVQSGAVLNGGSGFLALNTGWTNNGTFNAGLSTIIFAVANANAQINGVSTDFSNLIINKSNNANTVTINTTITAQKLSLNRGIASINTVSGSLTVQNLVTNNTTGQVASLKGVMTVTGSAALNSGSTLNLSGASTNLLIDGNLTADGSLTSDNANATITFQNSIPSNISGANVSLNAKVRVAKTGTALTSFTTGTAASIAGDLIVDSRLEVNRTLVVTGETTVNGLLEAKSSDITFGGMVINAGGTFSALASPTNIFLTGNWTSSTAGAIFNANNSTLILTGSTNSLITPGANTVFNRMTVQKTSGAMVSYQSNPLIISSDLTIQTGALLCANTATGSTFFNPAGICTGDEVAIPNADIAVGGDLLIYNMAALRLDEDDTENNLNEISLWLKGALTDNNLAEPTYTTPARRGLLIGSQNVALRLSNLNRPFIVFTGGDMEVRGNVPQLRDSEGAPSQGLGLALPNVIIYKDDNSKVLTVNNGNNPDLPGDRHKLRVLGNLTIAQGTLFANATSLLFGDSQNDEVNVFGVLDINPGSTLKMTTGGASTSGSILRGRRGGVVKFIGTPSYPVTVSREGTPGNYFGIGIYEGCTIYAYSANFTYLTSSNEDYSTTSPEQTVVTINEAGNGCAMPGTGGYQSYGGLKVYQGASINPEKLTDPIIDTQSPFYLAEYNFSFCTFAGSANGMSHLTINTGQTLTIKNISFTLPNGDPNSGKEGQADFQKFSNIVANNPTTNNLSVTPTNATSTSPVPTITVLRSNGNAAGLNAEYYDGGDFELGYPNTATSTIPNSNKGRIVWETLPFFFWVGGYDTKAFDRKSSGAQYTANDKDTDWTNWKNWSLASNDPASTGLTTYYNPNKIFPGQRTLSQATCDPADKPASLPVIIATQPDALDYYEVFICRSAVADPILNTAQVTIQGSLIINSGVTVDYSDNNKVFASDVSTKPNLKVDRFDINPHSSNVVDNFRILYIGNNTLNVRGDLVTEVNGILDATGNGTIRVGGNISMMANLPYNNSIPPGTSTSSSRNVNQNNANTTFQYLYRSGTPTMIIDGIGQQEIRMRRNVLHKLVIDKPYNVVGVQGLSGTNETTRFTVNDSLVIKSGGLMLLSNTPMLINGTFALKGGTFNYNQKSYVTVRGNWQNTGGSVLLGSEAARINFHPKDSNPREILSAGQPFPKANFGHEDDATQFNNSYWIDRSPETYPTTGGEFTNGVFGTNSNVVPYLEKTKTGVVAKSVLNPNAPDLPKVLISNNVVYTIKDNFTSTSLTTIYPNRSVTTVEGVSTLIKTGGLTIQSQGTMDLKGGAELLLQTLPATAPATNTLLVSNGATLRAIGTPSSYVKISRQNTSGSYTFKVDGTISARYYLIEFMDINGIDMRSGTALATSPGMLSAGYPAGCFSDGILTNGTPGGTYLNIGANTFTTGTVIYNASFPMSLGGVGSAFNVRQAPFPTTGAGVVIYFKDATGVYAGESFDGDPDDGSMYNSITPPVPSATPKTFYGNIRWIDRIKRWIGGGIADTRWSTPANWADNVVPTVDDDVLLDFSSPAPGADFSNGYLVTIDASLATCRNLTVTDANALGSPTGKKIYIIMTNNPASDLTVLGDYTADAKTDLRTTSGMNNNIKIGRSWSNEGRFRSQSATAILPVSPLSATGANTLDGLGTAFDNVTGGTVEFTENVGKRVIQTGKAATGEFYDPFWNVEFKAGSTEINDVLRVNNDLTIRQGAILDASLGNNPVFIQGNWLNDGGTFVPRQGRVTMLGNKVDAAGVAQPTYITKNKSTGIAGGVENFFDLAIYKQYAPGITDINVIGSNPNNVILNNRVTVASNLIFYRGRFVSATDKEMILLENAGFYRDSRDGTEVPKSFSQSVLTALQNLGAPVAPGSSSTQVNFYSGYVNGPVGRFFSSSTSDVMGRFPISKDGEYIADPVNGVVLTVRLTTNKPTVFSLEQFNANPDFPSPPATRTIPTPLNYVSQSRYWVVKNIADSPVPFPSTSVGELLEGSISLPYRGAQEVAPSVGPWYTEPNFGTAAAMAKLLQISILQDHSSYSTPYATNVLRGTAPKGTEWNNLGGVLNPTSSSMMVSTGSKFNTLGNGVFTFGFNYTPLPADLLEFTAKSRGQAVDLAWVAANEENVAEYVVQRSTDGKHFDTIGTVTAKGSNTTQLYRLTDENPVSGINYYRLKQVDIHHLESDSKTVSARIGTDKMEITGELAVYPNPLEAYHSAVHVVVPDEVSGTVRVSIVDMKGQHVYTNDYNSDGSKLITVQYTQKLPAGMYVVQVKTLQGVFQKKLIVR